MDHLCFCKDRISSSSNSRASANSIILDCPLTVHLPSTGSPSPSTVSPSPSTAYLRLHLNGLTFAFTSTGHLHPLPAHLHLQRHPFAFYRLTFHLQQAVFTSMVHFSPSTLTFALPAHLHLQQAHLHLSTGLLHLQQAHLHLRRFAFTFNGSLALQRFHFTFDGSPSPSTGSPSPSTGSPSPSPVSPSPSTVSPSPSTAHFHLQRVRVLITSETSVPGSTLVPATGSWLITMPAGINS